MVIVMNEYLDEIREINVKIRTIKTEIQRLNQQISYLQNQKDIMLAEMEENEYSECAQIQDRLDYNAIFEKIRVQGYISVLL